MLLKAAHKPTFLRFRNEASLDQQLVYQIYCSASKMFLPQLMQSKGVVQQLKLLSHPA